MVSPSSSRALTRARRLTLLAWIVVALLPLAYIATQAVAYSRNIVFWDEIDTALDLILRLDFGADAREVLQRIFAINNEHRMVTSRLLFATSYWLTGTINFHVIGAIGNLFLVAAAAILVWSGPAGAERRVRMAVVVSFLLFQLEHFENVLWSGASIDHFQVPLLAIATFAALARGSRVSLAAAAALALTATFTLAHGTLAWPCGALLLLQQRRWKPLALWCACAVAAAGAFLYGFEFNPGHRIEGPSEKNALMIARYWLELLGGPLTLGEAAFAPVFGIALLAGLALVGARGGAQREPVAFFTALFAVASLALVAVGRAELAGPDINSRYLILGALAWAMLLFLLLELATDPARPFRWLLIVTPALAVFTIACNVKFAPIAEGFIEVRDRAATSFMTHGEDGRGVTRLHPNSEHATALLRVAAERGVYTLPRVSHPAPLDDAAAPNPDIVLHFDEFSVNDRNVTLGGWAMIPGRQSRRGQTRVLLHSPDAQLAFTTVTFVRSDVAQAYREPKWLRSGFRAVIDRALLPALDFDVGVVIDTGDRDEFVFTSNRLLLSTSPARAVHRPSSP